MDDIIKALEQCIPNSREGLPQEVFEFISRLTPMVNVDLLVKDGRGTLLSWRDDEYSGPGWHVPGGIVRFKEDFATRIEKVAETELGTIVEFGTDPVAINQVFCDHDTRGHFISFLFECSVAKDYEPDNGELSENDVGYMRWHKSCPDNIVKVHEMYRGLI